MIYPNLETLDSFFTRQLSHHPKFDGLRGGNAIYVFPQMWPNTGGGMAQPGYFYGSAITRQYTTVLVNTHNSAAMVCFGNTPAYFVMPYNQAFLNDLHARKMAGVKDFTRYDGGKQHGS